MKGFKICVILIFVLINCSLSGQNYKQKVIDYLKKEIVEQKIPGLQIAVIKNNEIVLSESLGFSDVSFSVKTDKNTIFSINSIAKVFASTAILQLVEKNKIKITDLISTHLDSLPENWNKINVKHLLSHTSGLPDIEDSISGDLISSKGQDSAWIKVRKIPLRFKAGDKFDYNATNYLLIQKLIEKYNTSTFEEFVKLNQFDRAGIENISFGNSFDVVKNKSPTYCYYYQDKVTREYLKGNKLLHVREEFPTMLRADAGAFSSANDIAKWIIALQTGKFLKKKTSIDIMLNPVNLNNGEYDGFDELLNAYALGWPVIMRNKHPAVAPIGGGRAAFVTYTTDNLSIVLLTNLSGIYTHKIIENISKMYFN